MIIDTVVWGNLEIDDKHVYHFAKGIPGFEEETEFVLIEQEQTPFEYLQSIKNRELSFLLTDPFLFYPDYEFELPDSDAKELELDNEVMVRCILTLRDPAENSTLNLLAPIVLNSDKHLGKQVVLHQTSYGTQHPLWGTDDFNRPEPRKAGK